jgi:membrane protease subunit (stomatin/prohibitin family)
MFRARRRPLLRAAMVGGAGYMAGKAGQRSADREDDQNQRLQSLETNQQPAPQAAPAAAPAAAAAPDMVGRLKELSELKASGALSQEEFDAAKAKVLAS